MQLNYHHLYYFWRVAQNGNLTRTAQELNLAQSALSTQIKQLEDRLGLALFAREGRSLKMTEKGRQVLVYADAIFQKGEELNAWVQGSSQEHEHLRLGFRASMSRNFVEGFLGPLLGNQEVTFTLQSRDQDALLEGLTHHRLDLVLTNVAVADYTGLICQLLDRQPVVVVGQRGWKLPNRITKAYQSKKWVLPVIESPIRSAFDGFCAQNGFTPQIMGEVEDMAMLRLMARDSGALAVLPEVVVKDELSRGDLQIYLALPDIFEHYYAIRVRKTEPAKWVDRLLAKRRTSERLER
ncbi:MAG: LysR family transcriptional regulator [Acidobacteria bacterium]|nr:LysR family transcriptional regulator [Acidobacteriota bacterium]MCB9396604.1 LysR family transcriptional regulator [Acidobacteriota bacterium]